MMSQTTAAENQHPPQTVNATPGGVGGAVAAIELRRDAEHVSSALRLLTVGCRLAVAGVFIAAAVPKIADPGSFAQSIHQFQLLPDLAINATALVLPWLELLAAVLLVTWRSFRPASATILLLLLVVFTTAISFNLIRGLDVACGCFGSRAGAGPAGYWHIARNLGLALLIVLGSILDDRRRDVA